MVVLLRIPSWWNQRAAHPENVMSPLELGYAAALLERQGIRTEVIDVEALALTPTQVENRLRELAPEFVFLQAITPAIPQTFALARFVKNHIPRNNKVVLVGQHASVLPQLVLEQEPAIDLCLLGEFEQKAVEVVTGTGTDTDGRAWRQGGAAVVSGTPVEIEDLDALPFPLHHLFRSSRYRVFHPTGVRRRWRWGFVLSSRGCPFSCLYCSPTLRNSYGKRYRFRSVANVIAELRELKRLGFTIVHFKDDLFTLRKDRIHELCEAMLTAGIDLPWTAQTRPDAVDLPLLRTMKRAGCRTLGLGVETGSERMLGVLRKGNSLEDVRKAFLWTRQVGIRTVGFFILGSPGETENDVEATYRLLREIQPNIIQVSFFTPYPGSAACDQELVSRVGPEAFSHYNRPLNQSCLSDARLRQLQRKFYLDFLSKTRFLPDYVRSEALPALLNVDQFLPFVKLSLSFLLRR